MRKRIIGTAPDASGAKHRHWRDLQSLALVELTSEDPEHPIEAALQDNGNGGWRAAEPGTQILRLLFDEPTAVHHIRLLFHEADTPRTQEFVLRWRSATEPELREIVRQQYNFSIPDSTEELEEYTVSLEALTQLELTITPDISGGDARASLRQWRVA